MPILPIPISDETRKFGLQMTEELNKVGKRLNGRAVTTDAYFGWILDRVVQEMADALEEEEDSMDEMAGGIKLTGMTFGTEIVIRFRLAKDWGQMAPAERMAALRVVSEQLRTLADEADEQRLELVQDVAG